MSKEWIEKRIRTLQGGDPFEKAWAEKLIAARSNGTLKCGVAWTEIHHAAKRVSDPEFLIKDWTDVGPSKF